VKQTIAGLIRYGFETPPFAIIFDNIDILIPGDISSATNDLSTLQSEDSVRIRKRGVIIGEFMRELIETLRPTRSIFLLGTAVSDSPILAKIFTHFERLPTDMSEEDIDFLIPTTADNLTRESYTGYSLEELVEWRKTGCDNRQIRRKLLQAGGSLLTSTSTRLGGLSAQFNELLQAILMPLIYPFLFEKPGMISTGAFVIGPSGTGKSALVDHVVKETGLPVEIVRGPDLLDKYIGASEMGVRKIFEKASSIAPCIVVFDAIDSLCPRRGSESTGVTDRVVNQMLCYLDGVEKIEGVFVIAISSRPDMVDPALTRSGRLDLTIICDVPDRVGTSEIIQCLWDEFVGLELLPEQLADLLNHVRDGCTGADIRSGFVTAKILTSRAILDDARPDIDMVRKCLANVKPSLSEHERRSMYSRTANGVGSRVMLH
jgi:hypothetical protein